MPHLATAVQEKGQGDEGCSYGFILFDDYVNGLAKSSSLSKPIFRGLHRL
jgi:hypothetical protein